MPEQARARSGSALSRHVSLATMATSMWTLFYLAGLSSNYYLDWSWAAQLWLIVFIPTLMLMAIVYLRIRRMRRPIHEACLSAFYFTAPFFAYDWIVLGVHEQRGWDFLSTHWYLTAFYFTPWLTLPPVGVIVSAMSRKFGVRSDRQC